jgi:hypothetical protein
MYFEERGYYFEIWDKKAGENMYKKVSFAAILIVVLISITVSAYAENRAVMTVPSLSFNGTTANCQVTIKKIGKPIEATLELWHGCTKIAGWHDSATSRLVISETTTVVSGVTYTLTVSGTIDGVPFSSTVITKTCP